MKDLALSSPDPSKPSDNCKPQKVSSPRARRNGHAAPSVTEGVTQAAWIAYRSTYFARYGVEPVRNTKVNSQIKQLCTRIPAEDVTATVTAYVRSPNAHYVAAEHSVGCLLIDAEKLRTEALTGRNGTSYAATQGDRLAGRGDEYAEMLARLDAEDRAKGLT